MRVIFVKDELSAECAAGAGGSRCDGAFVDHGAGIVWAWEWTGAVALLALGEDTVFSCLPGCEDVMSAAVASHNETWADTRAVRWKTEQELAPVRSKINRMFARLGMPHEFLTVVPGFVTVVVPAFCWKRTDVAELAAAQAECGYKFRLETQSDGSVLMHASTWG